MAQKRDKEETELKVPETLTPCSAPIPAPPKLPVADDATSSSARPLDASDPLADPMISTPPKVFSSDRPRSGSASAADRSGPPVPPRASTEAEARAKRRDVNRCAGCRRKVGLTGIRCRCGELFCSEHRYSDRHDCSFDYKAAGREAIARENPVVRPAKILKV